MAKDYSGIVALANRLITEFGRSITLVALDETVADVNAPWRGATDERSTNETTLSAVGVFVDPVSELRSGFIGIADGLIRSDDQLCLIPGTIDVKSYQFIRDRDQEWRIRLIRELKPANDVIYYVVALDS